MVVDGMVRGEFGSNYTACLVCGKLKYDRWISKVHALVYGDIGFEDGLHSLHK